MVQLAIDVEALSQILNTLESRGLLAQIARAEKLSDLVQHFAREEETMKRTPWFERTFLAVEDNGLLPGILERLEGTPPRLRALLADVDRSSEVESGWSLAQELGHLNDLQPLWLQRAGDIVDGKTDLTVADLSNRKTDRQITIAGRSQSTSTVLSGIARRWSPG